MADVDRTIIVIVVDGFVTSMDVWGKLVAHPTIKPIESEVKELIDARDRMREYQREQEIQMMKEFNADYYMKRELTEMQRLDRLFWWFRDPFPIHTSKLAPAMVIFNRGRISTKQHSTRQVKLYDRSRRARAKTHS